MSDDTIASNRLASARHLTAWIESGPVDGPLMIFQHGWPELGLCWRAQLTHFGRLGWRCIAPDMRGYGGSSIPTRVSDYAVREMVADMAELHDALGAEPAVWVGHDHGSMIAWAMAMHHSTRCRGVVSLTVPHFARGIGLPTLLPLVNRKTYPTERYPLGQWDYMQFYADHFDRAVKGFETNLEALMAMLYTRSSSKGIGKPAPLADIRAKGGWFGPTPGGEGAPPADELLSPTDKATMAQTFARTGFAGACAWYLNDTPNLAFAAEAPNFGRLTLPVLFLHAEWDTVCDSAFGHLAEPMREDCADLTEVAIAGGHMLMLEQPTEVNRALEVWLSERHLG